MRKAKVHSRKSKQWP